MKIYTEPARDQWDSLLSRPLQQENATIRERVERIIDRVRTDGDRALRELAEEIDGVRLDQLAVTDAEIAAADTRLAEPLKAAIRQAQENVAAFHAAQKMEPIRVETMPGVACQQRSVPIHRVGLYIPGGSAPLFSTVLMLARFRQL